MSEASSADKSEQATDQKLRRVREEGQVPRSRDLATAVGLIATIQVTAWMMPTHLERFRGLLLRGFADASGSGSLDNAWSTVWHEAWLLLMALVAPLAITPVLVFVTSLIPGGWLFSTSNWEPKFNRLSPQSNLGRLVSGKHYAEFGMSVLKAATVGVVVYLFCSASIPRFVSLAAMPLDQAVKSGVDLFMEGVMAVVMVFVVLALLDAPLQRFLFLLGQRMSKQEVKEEHKSAEGRPEVRQRIRQIQRQLSQRSIRKSVPEADAIIVNPEHYAVAVRYNATKAEAPYVVAKGIDEMALYIREVARRHNVEIVHLPPLARAIYHTSQVNQQIPAALYRAVAQTLHYVLQIKAFRSGERTSVPPLPTDLDVPAHLSEPVTP
jgi:flagellar biosynthetic protein FlhB